MKYLAIHNSGVSQIEQSVQIYSVNRWHKNAKDAKGNFRYHYGSPSTLGWFVAYNFFLDVNATLTNTRAEGTETAAQTGHNFDTISICIAFNGDREYPNDKQIRVLKKFIEDRPNLEVKFHHELQKYRTCAGVLITHQWLDSVLHPKIVSIPKLEDEKKAEEIKRLSSILDKLRALLNKLLAFYK